MIALLLAASLHAAPARPLIFTGTIAGSVSEGYIGRHRVIRYQRATAGVRPPIPAWVTRVPTGSVGITLTVSGQEITATIPAFRWAIAEYSALSGGVAYRVQRAGVDWRGRFLSNETLGLWTASHTGTGGDVLIGFRPTTNNGVISLWWGN